MPGRLRDVRLTLGCALAIGLIGGGGLGCNDSGGAPMVDAGMERPLRIEPPTEAVAIKPGESYELVFRLLDEDGRPTPSRVLQFGIIDDPTVSGDDARGATLSFDRSMTDEAGRVRLQVIAGLSTAFRVRASSAGAPSVDVLVFVTEATHAPAEIVPTMLEPAPGVTEVRVHMLDGAACAGLSWRSPPRSSYPVRTTTLESGLRYSTVSTDSTHAVLGIGVDATGTGRAWGCVDLPGQALLPREAVRVLLPLLPLRPAVDGQFRAVSDVQFTPALRPIETLAAAWGSLGSCAQDPARLWLDCTIDALATSNTDPLDCRPGAEGPLGDKLLARRGPVTTAATRCRDSKAEGGRASLDEMVQAMFLRPWPKYLEELRALGPEVRGLFARLRLHSTMSLARTPLPDRLHLAHRLRAFEMGPANKPVMVLLEELGAPSLEARFVPVTARRSELDVGSHGFSARVGSAARLAFGTSSLMSRGAPREIGPFVEAMAASARYADRGTTLMGCPALDAYACTEIGEPRGCLIEACRAGLGTLASLLGYGFEALDGEDLDLHLAGTVPVFDRNGDERAEALGTAGEAPGLWSGQLRAREGTTGFTSLWTAMRETP